MNRTRLALGLCVINVALTACAENSGTPRAPIQGGHGSPTSTPAPSATPVASAAPSASPTSHPSPTPVPSPTPAATASPAPSPTPKPSATPSGSTSGSVYVANEEGNSITVYAPNLSGAENVAPSAAIVGGNTGLSEPYGVALDGAGKIYVANAAGGNGNGSITVYAATPSGTLNETPLATIAGNVTGLANPHSIALDATGKIYVVNNSSVTVYPANPSGTMNETPLATIAGNNAGLFGPFGIALDASGKIYVSNPNGGAGQNGSITTYAANPSGPMNEAPLATIAGSDTGLAEPNGVALDATGKIFAVNYNNSSAASITGYAASPSGSLDETPFATIAGSQTVLQTPDGIALDAIGQIYVANTQGLNAHSGEITVYAANPSGAISEAPFATIGGSNTGLDNPAGVAVR